MTRRGAGRLPVAALVLVAGCSHGPTRPAQPAAPPPRIAVLPFANATNDLQAPDLARALIAQRLARRGWIVTPPEQVDAGLKAAGVTDGGQLAALPPDKLAAAVGPGWLMTGTVTKASYVTLGVYLKREVEIAAAIGGPGAAPAWRNTARINHQDLSLDAAKNAASFTRSLTEQLAGKAVEGIFSHKLAPEFKECVAKLTAPLHAGSFSEWPPAAAPAP